MRFQDLLFFDMISWILLWKKILLVLLIKSLKSFQLAIDLKEQYTFSLMLHSLFHHALENLVILIFFECLYYRESKIDIFSWTASSRDFLLSISEVLMLPIVFLNSLTNFSMIEMLTDKGA